MPTSAQRTALRIMRALDTQTGGRAQSWRSLVELGATETDAAGIAHAVGRGWLRISGELHSVSLTENGRRRLRSRKSRSGR
jgi:hypothetical protein